MEVKETRERHGDPEAEEVGAGEEEEEEEEEEATYIHHLLRQRQTHRRQAWRVKRQPPPPPSRLLRLPLEPRLPLRRRLLRLSRNEGAETQGGGLVQGRFRMAPALHIWYNP